MDFPLALETIKEYFNPSLKSEICRGENEKNQVVQGSKIGDIYSLGNIFHSGKGRMGNVYGKDSRG